MAIREMRGHEGRWIPGQTQTRDISVRPLSPKTPVCSSVFIRNSSLKTVKEEQEPLGSLVFEIIEFLSVFILQLSQYPLSYACKHGHRWLLQSV